MEIVCFDRDSADDFLKAQYSIGQSFSDRVEFYYQTPVDILKKKYIQQSFDPCTRLYAIDGGKIHGFITGKIIHSISEDELYLQNVVGVDFPDGVGIILPPLTAEDCPEGTDRLLLGQLLHSLRDRGVGRVFCTLGSNWGQVDLLGDHGFQKKFPFLLRAIVKVDDLCREMGGEVDVIEYSPLYEDTVSKLLNTHLGYSVETARSILRDDVYQFSRRLCVIDDSEIQAWVQLSYTDGVWQMGPIYPRDGMTSIHVNGLLSEISRILQIEGANELHILCGVQGMGLLRYLPNFRFNEVMSVYELV